MTSSMLHKNKTMKIHIFLRWGMLDVTQDCYENLNAVYKVPSPDKPGVWRAVGV
jgi:hypothetical protein